MTDDLIRVFDAYGREMQVPREEWRTKVLPGALQKAHGDAAELYDVVVQALQDGFERDVVESAEHLARIDPVPARGATVLGIVYTKLGRLDDAQRVLERFPRDGVAQTNLAKVHAARGDAAKADEVLWHAATASAQARMALAWWPSRAGEASSGPRR